MTPTSFPLPDYEPTPEQLKSQLAFEKKKSEIMLREINALLKENYELRGSQVTAVQLSLIVEAEINRQMDRAIQFGPSSERFRKVPKDPQTEPKAKKPRLKKPSEKYPNIPVRELEVRIDPLPTCTSCGGQMTESGMMEESEQLNVIPKKFEIIRTLRHKYTCNCHSCIKTAPVAPRIIPGSAYSDEMIIDISMSKYCDLVPVNRYAAMARRESGINLPPNSLIEGSHCLAATVLPAYDLLRENILQEWCLSADETPHRMLEGSEKKSWVLWGFSSGKLCWLQCRDTRSASVAHEFLEKSKCEVLLSDKYTGYDKSVSDCNAKRFESKEPLIRNAYCNAHSRRNFFRSAGEFPEANFYLEKYHEIYKIEAKAREGPLLQILQQRDLMVPLFQEMRRRAELELHSYSEKSKYKKALHYFFSGYGGLTLFLRHHQVPIDNNNQERILRNPVIGRKTWYGTHSEKGAQTAAILFSLVETCKLNGVNPRHYFKKLVQDLHNGLGPFLPSNSDRLGQI